MGGGKEMRAGIREDGNKINKHRDKIRGVVVTYASKRHLPNEKSELQHPEKKERKILYGHR